MWPSKVLIKMTGSIAAYKVCDLISRLKKEGREIRVVMSHGALNFVGISTIEGLSGHRVYSDTFASGQAMEHIDLDRWADVVVLAPATANSINKLANGLGDDLISTLFLAHDREKPYFIAPAMNAKMYEHPVTQDSLKKLAHWGIQIIEPEDGVLACGEEGAGRLASVDSIYKSIFELDSQKQDSLKILVTAGGTSEPIDGVRCLTNFSTGHTGTALARQFSSLGHNVTLLRSAMSKVDAHELTNVNTFTDFESLALQLRNELQTHNYDLVVHAAAVSDFSVANPSETKLSSSSSMTLKLKPNPKLVHALKDWSKNSNMTVVAFKLTRNPNVQVRHKAIEKLLNHSAVDFVVHNDFDEIKRGEHIFRIYNSDSGLTETTQISELARNILQASSERPLDKAPLTFTLKGEADRKEIPNDLMP